MLNRVRNDGRLGAEVARSRRGVPSPKMHLGRGAQSIFWRAVPAVPAPGAPLNPKYQLSIETYSAKNGARAAEIGAPDFSAETPRFEKVFESVRECTMSEASQSLSQK